MSFSSDNAEIVDNLRKYFKIEAPEKESEDLEWISIFSWAILCLIFYFIFNL